MSRDEFDAELLVDDVLDRFLPEQPREGVELAIGREEEELSLDEGDVIEVPLVGFTREDVPVLVALRVSDAHDPLRYVLSDFVVVGGSEEPWSRA